MEANIWLNAPPRKQTDANIPVKQKTAKITREKMVEKCTF